MSDRRLVLWDIDRTLITGGNAGRQICAIAFRIHTGLEMTRHFITDGSTDPAILRELMRLHGVEGDLPPMSRVDEVLTEAFALCRDDWVRQARPLAGASAALDALAERDDIVQSVLTGNVRPNAHAKLASLGLDRHLDFAVGGYGSDSAERPRLVPIAQARAAAKYGGTFTPANTVLIGDTPRDVHAGRDGGARVVAVATGRYTVAELRAAGAETVLDDLTDLDALLAHLDA